MRKLCAISTLAIAASALVVSCSTAKEAPSGVVVGRNSGVSYPLVKPPVVAATPAGFGGSASNSKAHRKETPKAIDDSADASDDSSGGEGGGMPPGAGDGGIVYAGDGGGGACPDGGTCGPSGGGPPSGFQASDIDSRFFSDGPTNIFGILTTIDTIIGNINGGVATSTDPCITQTPVAYTLGTFANGVTMYAQCYELQDPLTQFGTNNGITYIYAAAGTGPGALAAIATPIPGSAGDDGGTPQYTVQAWLTIGANNATSGCGGGVAWDDCSYGVIALSANEATATFEMTVAGLGFGFCGAQLKSDGTNIYATGSPDMGATCGATQTLCVSAADLSTTSTTCTGTSVTSFSLPPLGRETTVGSPGAAQDPTPDAGEVFAASTYPGAGDQIILNGTSTDSLAFGPTTPTPGVGEFSLGGPVVGPGDAGDVSGSGDGAVVGEIPDGGIRADGASP